MLKKLRYVFLLGFICICPPIMHAEVNPTNTSLSPHSLAIYAGSLNTQKLKTIILTIFCTFSTFKKLFL